MLHECRSIFSCGKNNIICYHIFFNQLSLGLPVSFLFLFISFTCVRTHTRKNAQIYTHTRAHTRRTHARAHTHARTHTRTHVRTGYVDSHQFQKNRMDMLSSFSKMRKRKSASDENIYLREILISPIVHVRSIYLKFVTIDIPNTHKDTRTNTYHVASCIRFAASCWT